MVSLRLDCAALRASNQLSPAATTKNAHPFAERTSCLFLIGFAWFCCEMQRCFCSVVNEKTCRRLSQPLCGWIERHCCHFTLMLLYGLWFLWCIIYYDRYYLYVDIWWYWCIRSMIQSGRSVSTIPRHFETYRDGQARSRIHGGGFVWHNMIFDVIPCSWALKIWGL